MRRTPWGRVILAALAAVIVGLAAMGAQPPVWTYRTPLAILYAPTVASDGSVYFAADDSRIYAVSPSGSFLWNTDAGGRPSAAMALQNNTLYFPTSQGELAAYGVDGHMAWRLNLYSQMSATPAVAADGTIYIGTISGRLYSVNPAGFVNWRVDLGNAVLTSPVIGQSGRIYVASLRNLYAFNSSGEAVNITPIGRFVSTPMALDANDNLYYVDSQGAAFSRASNGSIRWKGEGSSTDTVTAASPCVSSDAVFLSVAFTPVPPKTYKVSGTILLSGGGGLRGVTVSAPEASGITATTDTSGNYSLSGLANGTYTITPTLAGYAFTPVTKSATVNGADVTGVTFYARAGYSISGTITLSSGTGLPGVSVNTFGASATTNADGQYSLDGLPNGTYTVSPSLATYTFAPPTLTVIIASSSVPGQNFTATKTPAATTGKDSATEAAATEQVGAYNLTDGTSVWSPLSLGSSYGTALGADGTLYVPNASDLKVYLLDAATGTTNDTITLKGTPADMVLADTSAGPRLYVAASGWGLVCYAAAAGPDPTAPWSQIGAGPRHLYRRDDPPTVSITEPQAGDTVSGAVTVSTNTFDDFSDGLSVQFFLDGIGIGTVTSPPYEATWYSQTSLNSSHILSVKAKDSAGLMAEDSVTVTSNNSGGSFTVYPDSPSVPFSWAPGPETKFRVEFAKDAAFASILATSKTPDKPWLTATTWKPGSETWKKVLDSAKSAGTSTTPVYWRVVGKASGTLPGQGGTFEISGTMIPDNLTPPDGSSVSASTPPTFGWNPEHNSKFRVEVSTTRDFSSGIKLSSKVPGQAWLSAASWKPPKAGWKKTAGSASTLYWRVAAQDSLGRSGTSAASSLSIGP